MCSSSSLIQDVVELSQAFAWLDNVLQFIYFIAYAVCAIVKSFFLYFCCVLYVQSRTKFLFSFCEMPLIVVPLENLSLSLYEPLWATTNQGEGGDGKACAQIRDVYTRSVQYGWFRHLMGGGPICDRLMVGIVSTI